MDFLRESAGLSVLGERLAEAEALISESREGSSDLRRRLAEHEEIEREFSHRGGYEFEPTAAKVLRGLGFEPGDSERTCDEFSGGWRMRLALAAVLLKRPDVLLLDEPTNHLDSESMEWLEGWLRDHRGVMIFVSHDRRFLGKMAAEIAEIARGEVTRYSMGYERYVVEREEARARRERLASDQKERIEQIQRFVERFRYKATKAAQVQSRIRQLERMEVYETDTPQRSVNIKLPEAARSGHNVITAFGIAKRYGDREVFSRLDLEINRGQRVSLVGVNGAGKSTLLRVLSGVEVPDEGSVRLGHNVRFAYFSQESAQNLNYAHTVWEEACRTGSRVTEAEKRSLLGSFLFSGDDINKPVRVLSGGEKSRVALFKLLLSDSNFLILDEPTNHLDMNTREIFQRALLQYGGTLLIVSHDRFFLDDLANRVVEIRDGRLYDYPGNYSHFIAKREELMACAEGDAPPPRGTEGACPDAPDDSRARRRSEAEERNRLYRKRKAFADRIALIEGRIEENEARRDEIDRSLCLPDVLSNSAAVQSLMIERKSLDESIASDYAKWEELGASMEAVK
jgi:ATP-binding cassette subfamily F protein 3